MYNNYLNKDNIPPTRINSLVNHCRVLHAHSLHIFIYKMVCCRIFKVCFIYTSPCCNWSESRVKYNSYNNPQYLCRHNKNQMLLAKIYPAFYSFLRLIVISCILAFSRANWFTSWMAMEVVLLSFIPIFNYNKETRAAIKYFIIQLIGSLFFLCGTMIGYFFIVTIRLLLKLGLGPFFMWVPVVIIEMSWVSIFLLRTFQKLPALAVCLTPLAYPTYIYMLAVLSIIIAAILGVNETKLRKIMAFSSIIHTSYLYMSVMYNVITTIFFFPLYFFSLLLLILKFNVKDLSSLQDLSTINVNILVFNIIGIPPLPIFYIKVLFIGLIRGFIRYILLLRIIISAFMYINMVIPSALRNNKSVPILLPVIFLVTYMFMKILLYFI